MHTFVYLHRKRRIAKSLTVAEIFKTQARNCVLHLLFLSCCFFCESALPAVFATDADTGVALPHTWMIATRTVCQGFGHCSSSCVEVRAAEDKNVIPIWRSNSDYVWQFYRDGYYQVHPNPNQPQLSRKRPSDLASGWDDASARIAYLGILATQAQCRQASASDQQQLVPFLRELLSEGFALATLPEQKESLHMDCEYLESLAGSEAMPPGCSEKLDWHERDALLNAARKGDLNTLSAMLPKVITPVYRARRLGPALAAAAMAGQAPVMQYLIAQHADMGPAFEQVFQQSMGSYSTNSDFQPRTATVRRIVRSVNDPPPAAQTEPPLTPVERARIAVEVFLAAGADASAGNSPGGQTPLHRAALMGDTKMIDLLLRYGALVNQPEVACPAERCNNAKTPLMLAANPAIAEQLIAAGANVNATDGLGYPALMAIGRPEVASVLVDHGADVNVALSNGVTPLMYWLRPYEQFHKSPPAVDLIRRLVAAGASLTAKGSDGVPAIDLVKDPQLKAELQKIAANRLAKAH